MLCSNAAGVVHDGGVHSCVLMQLEPYMTEEFIHTVFYCSWSRT